MPVCLSYESFDTCVAFEEVRSLPASELHMLPLPCVLTFEGAREEQVEWTTDRDYHAMNARTGCLSPSQYATKAFSPKETIGELERRLKLKLVRVRIVHREEVKNGRA